MVFEFLKSSKYNFLLIGGNATQEMYSACEEAVKSHNAMNTPVEITPEEESRSWDEVFAKNAADSMCLFKC
jgi:hypothetical protein